MLTEVDTDTADTAYRLAVAHRFRRLRLDAGITQDALARRLFCVPSAITQFERGIRPDFRLRLLNDRAAAIGHPLTLVLEPTDMIMVVVLHAMGEPAHGDDAGITHAVAVLKASGTQHGLRICDHGWMQRWTSPQAGTMQRIARMVGARLVLRFDNDPHGPIETTEDHQ